MFQFLRAGDQLPMILKGHAYAFEVALLETFIGAPRVNVEQKGHNQFQ